jgi:hypothetical protein
MLFSPYSSVSCVAPCEFPQKNHEKISRIDVARPIPGQWWKMGYHFEAHVNPDSKHVLLFLIGTFYGP